MLRFNLVLKPVKDENIQNVTYGGFFMFCATIFGGHNILLKVKKNINNERYYENSFYLKKHTLRNI